MVGIDIEVTSEVWSDDEARPRNGTPVLDCCWLGSECSETVSTPSEVNSISCGLLLLMRSGIDPLV